jgi:hypothetical protein
MGILADPGPLALAGHPCGPGDRLMRNIHRL